VQRSLLVEGHGRPRAAVVAAAHVPADQRLAATRAALVLARPEPEPACEPHRGLDAGFATPTGWDATVDHDDCAHRRLTHPPRRAAESATARRVGC